MARGFLRVALLALALCLAVDGGDASPVTKSEIGSSAGATRKLLAAHQYRMREKVPLYANKAGPFHNPSEVRRGSATSTKPAPTTAFLDRTREDNERRRFAGRSLLGTPRRPAIADRPRACPSSGHGGADAPLRPNLSEAPTAPD
jgi:hypothetical protein